MEDQKKNTWEDITLYLLCFTLVIFLGFYFYTMPDKNKTDGIATSAIYKDLEIVNGHSDASNYLKAQLQLIHRRYDFANNVAKSNVLLKYVAFLVGTLLTVLGTSVVIRGVRNSTTNLEGGNGSAKISFSIASPGVVVVVSGTLIILFSIYKGHEVSYEDGGIQFLTKPAKDSISDPFTEPIITTPINPPLK